MNSTEKLFNTIYTTAEMGKLSISELQKKTADEEFAALMNSHYGEYDRMSREVLMEIAATGSTPKQINKPADWFQKGMIKANAMMSDTLGEYAEMMIQGTNMGIIDIEKAKRQQDLTLNPKQTQLVERTLRTLNNNVNSLKPFLSR